MPGTVTVDTRATFTAMIVMSIAEKMIFGTDQPSITKAGEKQYVAELAVTYVAEPGMRPVSEVISPTITGPGPDVLGIPQGSVVELDRLRCGVSAPERKENGRIAGGRLYWMASGIRPAGAGGLRPVKNEQAS
jgi:hypothetical protein